MNNPEKVNYIDKQTRLIEARLKSTQGQFLGVGDQVKATEAASDMLIDSIQAKVAILDAL